MGKSNDLEEKIIENAKKHPILATLSTVTFPPAILGATELGIKALTGSQEPYLLSPYLPAMISGAFGFSIPFSETNNQMNELETQEVSRICFIYTLLSGLTAYGINYLIN